MCCHLWAFRGGECKPIFTINTSVLNLKKSRKLLVSVRFSGGFLKKIKSNKTINNSTLKDLQRASERNCEKKLFPKLHLGIVFKNELF